MGFVWSALLYLGLQLLSLAFVQHVFRLNVVQWQTSGTAPPPPNTHLHTLHSHMMASVPPLPPSLPSPPPPPLSLSPALFFYGSCSCFHHLPWLSFLFSSHPSLSLTLSLWWNKLCKAKDHGTRPTSQAHRLPFDIRRDKNLKCQPERKADKKCIVQKINKIGDGQHLCPWSILLATCTTLGVLALSLSDTALSLSLLLWFKPFAFLQFQVSGQCTCRANTQGLTCDTCSPQTYGLSAVNVDGCLRKYKSDKHHESLLQVLRCSAVFCLPSIPGYHPQTPSLPHNHSSHPTIFPFSLLPPPPSKKGPRRTAF